MVWKIELLASKYEKEVKKNQKIKNIAIYITLSKNKDMYTKIAKTSYLIFQIN